MERRLVERLAEFLHEQWKEWSHTLVLTERLSPVVLSEWTTRWIPFKQLPNETKALYRTRAEQIVSIIDEVVTVDLESVRSLLKGSSEEG